MTDSFMRSVNLFVEKSQANMETVVSKTGFKILAQLVEISPVGNPELWEVNQTAVNYNQAVFEHNEALKRPNNLTPKRGLLKNEFALMTLWISRHLRGIQEGDSVGIGKSLLIHLLMVKLGELINPAI